MLALIRRRTTRPDKEVDDVAEEEEEEDAAKEEEGKDASDNIHEKDMSQPTPTARRRQAVLALLST